MSKTVAVRAEIPEGLDAELDALATASGRSKSGLIADALRFYVQSERDFVAAVEEGLRALEAGDVLEHEQVVAAFEQRVARPR